MRMSLATVAVGVLFAASCGSDGDTVDRAELEARDAQERTEELEAQLEESEDAELRQELEDLQDQLAEGEGDGDTGGDGGNDTGGNTGGGNTGGGNTGVNTGGGAVAGTSVCDPDVEVNSVTSCPFARNVRDALYATNFVQGILDVYSPTTGQTYSMSCVINEVPIVCTGGNNAAVYVWP